MQCLGLMRKVKTVLNETQEALTARELMGLLQSKYGLDPKYRTILTYLTKLVAARFLTKVDNCKPTLYKKL